jgi:hypothetical protein
MNLRALHGLDRDIQQTLLNQIPDLWTHTSTASEGNTLTLGQTKFVIDQRDRKEYIDTLARYELEAGQLSPELGVWPTGASDAAFRAF